jgi:chemotaxis protein methyltransferase CheR
MDDDYGIRDTFDVVFFRNVMIYFDRGTQEAVIHKICRNLAPGGYLFAGHSESLASLDVPLRPIKTSIYRKPL